MSLYREHILDHYKHPRNFGTMENADVSLTIDNPLCGDQLTLYLKFIPSFSRACPERSEGRGRGGFEETGRESEQLVDAKFTGAGCAISVASASLLTDYLKGKIREELLQVDEDTVYQLLGIPISAARIQCALLPLNGLKNILIDVIASEAKQSDNRD